MAFEVDENGIQTPKLAEARARIVALWKARFGEDAQTSSDSPDGLTIDILSLLLALVWEGNAQVYNAAYFRTAPGVSLELLLDLFGRTRLPAQASTASMVLYGTPSSAVSPGFVASVESTEERFATDAAVTIGAADLVDVALIKTASSGTDYEIEVNSTTFTHTATPSSTTSTIVDALAALINAGAEPVSAFSGGTDADGYARLVIDSDSSGQSISSPNPTGEIQVYDASRVAATAENTGPVAASAGLLDVIETPTAGVAGCTTTADATLGRNRETDAQFRARHIDTLRNNGFGTPLAMRDRVLENVTTVLAGVVFENESESTDARGVPPHAANPVFLSEPVGGPYTDDEAIAEQLLIAKGAGIQSFGSTVVQLPNPQGLGPLIDIGFDRPTVRYLHLRITVTPGEGFPSTGSPGTSIRNSVVEYLQRGGEGYLDLGVDLVRFQLGEPINDAAPGIQSAVIETSATVNPGDPPSFSNADIAVDDDEILVADTSRTTVVIV